MTRVNVCPRGRAGVAERERTLDELRRILGVYRDALPIERRHLFDHPVWAALAMAAVALLTSVAGAAGPLGGILGFLLSLAYLLIAGIARTAGLVGLIPVQWAAVHIAVGCVAGLLVAFVGTAMRRRGEPEEVRAARARRPSRSSRSWPRCAASTSTPATAFAARSRWRSSCTSSSSTAVATRSGPSSRRSLSS